MNASHGYASGELKMVNIRSGIRKSLWPVVLLGCMLFSGKASTQNVNTLDRIHDPVIVTGSQVESFLGLPDSLIRIFRFSADMGLWEPVPFQIDEWSEAHGYFTQENPILEADDEIVLLARTFGDKAPDHVWPPVSHNWDRTRYQIEVNDPLDSQRSGWVSIFYDSSLASASQSSIQYYPDKDSVITENYTAVHKQSGVLENLYLNRSAGGDGIDLMDRQKFRFTFRIDLGVLGGKTITITEEMDKNFDLAGGFASLHFRVQKKNITVSGGCIRLHRQVVLEVRVTGTGIDEIIHELPFTTTFYPTFAEWSTDGLGLPDLSAGSFTAKWREVRLSTDLNIKSKGMFFTNPYNTTLFHRIDGIPDEPRRTLE